MTIETYSRESCTGRANLWAERSKHGRQIRQNIKMLLLNAALAVNLAKLSEKHFAEQCAELSAGRSFST